MQTFSFEYYSAHKLVLINKVSITKTVLNTCILCSSIARVNTGMQTNIKLLYTQSTNRCSYFKLSLLINIFLYNF